MMIYVVEGKLAASLSKCRHSQGLQDCKHAAELQATHARTAPKLTCWQFTSLVEALGLAAARNLAEETWKLAFSSKCCSKHGQFPQAADDVAAPLETAFALAAARALETFFSLAAPGAVLSSAALSSPAQH